MLIKILAGVIPLVSTIAVCLAGALCLAETGGPTAVAEAPPSSAIVQTDEPEQSYIGSDACFTCHRNQGGSWSETKHAKAFEVLPEKYRNDTSCLKCHVTAFGEPGGCSADITAESAKPFLSVGCESCHGPGAVHAAGVQKWMMAEAADEERLLKEMKAAIRKSTPDDVCAKCHVGQGHQQHPPYDGKPLSPVAKKDPMANGLNFQTASSVITAPPSPHSYSVKTCGSCHYEQYKTWRVGIHIGLSDKIPTKYREDKSCLECHRKSDDTSRWFTAATNPKDPDADQPQSGIGCESCHGPGLDHVLFNKRYIDAPPLQGELEQAARQSISKQKPAATCAQCHAQMAHKEHPKYEKPEDKPDVAKSK